MRIERYPVEKLKKELLDIIKKHADLAIHKVFFFGSRVTGGGTDRSDIDVGIEGPNPLPVTVLHAIKEDIEKLSVLSTR